MGLPFTVNDHVLIPRQDTETLVETILKDLKTGDHILDVCTGSGCIALSLAADINRSFITAADLSTAALDVAKSNAKALGISNVRFVEADILPSRGYFLTRGLGEAVIRLTRDTGLGAKVYLEKIPISSQTFAMAEEIGMDVVTAAMNGGDDYKFLFVIPLDKHETFRKEFHDFEIIGHLAQPDVGPVLVTPEGAELPIHAQGY